MQGVQFAPRLHHINGATSGVANVRGDTSASTRLPTNSVGAHEICTIHEKKTTQSNISSRRKRSHKLVRKHVKKALNGLPDQRGTAVRFLKTPAVALVGVAY